MHHGQVEGAEVLVERHVSEVIVDTEEERGSVVLGRLAVTHPEELV